MEKHKKASKTLMSHKTAKLLLIGGASALLLAIIGLTVYFTTGAQRSPADTLHRYYEGMYLTANLDQMGNCIEPGAREDFMLTYSLGGANNLATGYVSEMVAKIGMNGTLRVEITETQKKSSIELSKLRKTYPAIQDYAYADFLLHFSGSAGEHTLQGAATLIKLGGRWYLPNYQIAVGAATGQ